jgi:uncharacterized protein (TIGR00369 family)
MNQRIGGTEDLTGMEFLQKLIAENGRSPMQEVMSLNVVAAGDGWADVKGVPQPAFNNPMGRTHGGFAATLIDTALGCAVASKQGRGVRFGTVELKINYVGKIDSTTGPVLCHATVLHAGRTMLTAEAKVTDQAGKLLAHGSGTFLVFPEK